MTAAVAVVDSEPARAHAPLLDALERALPVSFEWLPADAARDRPVALALDPAAGYSPGAGQRAFSVTPGEGSPAGRPRVGLADAAELDRRLRGAELDDPAAASAAPLGAAEGETVMAAAAGAPLWIRSGGHDRVSVAPDGLGEGSLLSLLSPGRWLSLLPLLHFLRELEAPGAWTPPALRAAFLIDDPNLHLPRYGHIRYPELIEHADEHGYHTSFAMVPLDAWYAHPRAARLFRERSDRISLVFHGNDHVKRELAIERSEDETRAMLGQALRRMAAFERRSGVSVDPVMTAPHGACSLETMRALPAFGFEAACISRPYPWLDSPPPGQTLAGWEAGAVVAAGTPVVPRIPIEKSAELLPLRAFLDQPLVVYGHHEDLAHGLEPFATLAERIGGFGTVRWGSLAGICRSNYATRVEGEELVVRAYSRRLSVEVPDGVRQVRLELPAPEEDPAWSAAKVTGKPRDLRREGALWRTETLPVAGAGPLEVSVPHPAPLDPEGTAARRAGPWPLVRRALVETRDRLEPVRRR